MIIVINHFFQCNIGTADNLYKPVDTLMVFLKEFLEKVNFEKKSVDDNKTIKNTQHAKS